MPILKKFIKQPADVQDYDITFVAWLAALADTALSVSVPAVAGITQNQPAVLSDGVVKVWASGGTDGTDYKYTATLVTSAGRTKQVEIMIRVREV